ncbi:ankyrin repeat protein [Diplodia corticola]|uniref:Ankyrin repeat protein n=1 Tax=Diplodia corticola TaxID=236234 RepID=A0A1J9RI46_9PEZI|nr:ankyrin repeat protein [Diplodia corticola]OJD32227.1 ankyrin repeat protein [Diplodia corticola]
MEIAGLAIGAAGLVTLVDSCKRLMRKIDSYRHVTSEAHPILVEFFAWNHLFDRWLQHVTVHEGFLQTASGDRVDETTADVARNLISCIEDSLKSIEVVVSDFNKPAGLSTKAKVQWAYSKREKAVKGVQELFRFVQELHLVLPVSGTSGDASSSAHGLSDEVVARLDKLRERYRADDRRNIHQWLGAKSTESYYEERLRDRKDGTCSWIFRHPDLVSWISPEFPDDLAKVLWIHAPAGFGKTVLCATIVESLKMTAPHTTALYFFSDREDDTYAILRSWISQIVYQHDDAMQIVADNPRLTSTPTATHSDLEEVFRSIAQSNLSFTFVVDGLDECEDPNQPDIIDTNRSRFVGALRALISGTKTRAMIVSRPFLDIRSSIHPERTSDRLAIFEIPVSADDVDDDLKAFSRAIVDRRLSNQPKASREGLAVQMAERASGMFLWVKLLESRLRRSRNQKKLQDTIRDMPEGLDSTYKRNMERIKSQHPVDRDRALLILMWIVVGRSPPTVAQIAIGFAVQRSESSADLQCDELPDLIDQHYVDEDIIETCAGLVEVNVDSRIPSLQHRSIRFVHSSVRDYLRHLAPGESLGVPFSDHGLQRGRLCAILLRFLTYESAWKTPPFRPEDVKLSLFRDFATLSWPQYVPTSVSTELRMLVDAFFSVRNYRWECWRTAFEKMTISLNVLWMRDSVWEDRKKNYFTHDFLLEASEFPQYPEPTDVQEIGEIVRARAGEAFNPPTDLSDLFEKLEPLVEIAFPHDRISESNMHVPGTRLYYAVLTRDIGIVRTTIDSDPDSVNTPGGLQGSALQLACWMDSLDMVEELLNKGVDVNLESGCMGCALNVAAWSGNQHVVQILHRFGASLQARDSRGWDALFRAVTGSNSKVVEQLLQYGAKPNSRYEYLYSTDMTPLMAAATFNEVEIFGLLLANGADISACSGEKETCLHFAAVKGFVEIVDAIMSVDESKNILDSFNADGDCPLSLAIFLHKDTTVALRLLSHGAKYDIPNSDGWTPLHDAIDENLPDVVQAMLTVGVGDGINAQDLDGWTPLHIAADRGNERLCGQLLSHGADSKLATRDGRTPLHMAALDGHVEIARQLLDHGSIVDAKDESGKTPLHLAASEANTEMIDLLVHFHADMSAVDAHDHTPIVMAAHRGQLEVYKNLLSHGANERMNESLRHTPLHSAAEAGKFGMVQYLLDRGWDANLPDIKKQTALHMAVRFGHKDILGILLDRGSCTTTIDQDGDTPLHSAAYEGHADILERGPPEYFEAHDGDGIKPLHIAAQFGKVNVLKLLSSRFPGSVDDRTLDGWTPLALATLFGHASTMEVLLEHGADPFALTPDDETLIQVAIDDGHAEAVKVLLREMHKQVTVSTKLPPLSDIDDCAADDPLSHLNEANCRKLGRSRSLSQIEIQDSITDNTIPLSRACSFSHSV